MPAFTPLVIAILAMTHVGELAASTLMLRNRYAARWRSLVSLLMYHLACGSIFTCIMLIKDPHVRAKAYFYTFWIAKIGEVLLQFWVLWQIVEKLLPHSRRIQRIGMAGFVFAAVSGLAISAYLSVHANIPFYLHITRFVLRAESASSLAWCLTFLLVAFCSEAIGILWRTEMLVVASGFALHVALRTLAVWATALRIPGNAASVLSASDFGFLISLVVWIFYFRSKREEKRIDRGIAAEIRGELQALRAMDV